MDATSLQQLRTFIYNQLYAAACYQSMSELTTDEKKKQRLLNFVVACKNNANYLDRFYQYHMTSSYNPIIEQPNMTGTFNEQLLEMLEFEAMSHYGFNNEAYNPLASTQYQELLAYVCNTCNTRGLLLLHMYLH